MEYPRLVYKYAGDKPKAGSASVHMLVMDENARGSALADGWYDNLGEALQPKKIEPTYPDPVPEVVEIAHKEEDIRECDVPPARAELDAKAKELGIKTYWKMKYETLCDKVTQIAGK